MSSTTRKITDVLPLSTTPQRHIPQLGLGTYLSPPERTLNSCLAALKAGYRQVDTGQYYENEAEVGQAIEQSGIPRGEVFVTTKILTAGASVEENYESCIASAKKLGGYVDCFLIHSPSPGPEKFGQMWLALEKLYHEGKAKSIGVSNFGIGQIEALKGVGSVWPPHVLQIEVSRSRFCDPIDRATLLTARIF
jgi:diketogulonate reductase-like aldo/keto reductase